MRKPLGVVSAFALAWGLAGCGGSGPSLAGNPAQDPQPQVVEIHIASTSAAPDAQLDGGTFPDSPLEQALVTLVDAQGVPTPLGSTDALPSSWTLAAGTYDVHYGYAAGQQVPRNLDARLATGLALAGASTIPIHVSAISIRPSFTLDGRAFPTGIGEVASFSLRRSGAPDDVVWLGTSENPILPVKVIPGTYDVVYHFESGGVVVPINQEKVILPDVTLDADGELPIDVPTLTFTSDFTLNGSPFPQNVYEQADFWLFDQATASRTLLGHTRDASSASHTLIPGTYDILYARVAGGAIVPRNPDAVVLRDVDVTYGDNQVAAVDVPAFFVTPVFTLDGAAFPADVYEQGDFFLVGSDRPTDEFKLGDSTASGSPVNLIPGTYDVYWRRTLGGAVVPRNGNKRVLDHAAILAAGDLPVDVPTIDVQPSLTLNGQPFPDDPYEHGNMSLRGPGGDEIPLGSTTNLAASAKIIPGVYDVVYTRQLGGAVVPRNDGRVVMTGVDLSSGGPLAIDVQAQLVQFAFFLDGLSFPHDGTREWTISLRDPGTGVENVIGPGASPAWWFIEGDYDVVYRYENGAGIPQNPQTVVGHVTIAP
jgi:hypothetical protein